MTQSSVASQPVAMGSLVFRIEFALWSLESERMRDAKKAGARVRMAAYGPTMNEYRGLDGWQLANLKKQIDRVIGEAKALYPAWKMGVVDDYKIVKGKVKRKRSGGRRRLVVVTREGSRMPDEIACDAIGGKCPIDRLVVAGVLRDDTYKWLGREARWLKTATGTGRVLVEVYEEKSNEG